MKDNNGRRHEDKKSFVVNVKMKVKKWQRLIRNKKHDHANSAAENFGIPPWHNQLNEEEYEEQHPEFYGAPMYESETAPDIYRDFRQKHAIQPSPSNSSMSDKHVTEDMQWKLTRTLSEILAPAYAMVSGTTTMIASKIQQTTPAAAHLSDKKDEAKRKQILNRGLTMKEYVFKKLEPGEDERALLQAITEAISPRKNYLEEPNTTPLPVSTMPHIQTATSVPTDHHYPLISSKSFPHEFAGSRELDQPPLWACPRCKSLMTPASSSLTYYKRSVTVNPDIFRRDSSSKCIEKTRRKTLREFLNPEIL